MSECQTGERSQQESSLLEDWFIGTCSSMGTMPYIALHVLFQKLSSLSSISFQVMPHREDSSRLFTLTTA